MRAAGVSLCGTATEDAECPPWGAALPVVLAARSGSQSDDRAAVREAAQGFHSAKDQAGGERKSCLRYGTFGATPGRILPSVAEDEEASPVIPSVTSLVSELAGWPGRPD